MRHVSDDSTLAAVAASDVRPGRTMLLLLVACVCAVLVLLPSEHWATGRIAAFLRAEVHGWARLVSMASVAAVASLLLLAMHRRRARSTPRPFRVATALFALSGVAPVVTTLFASGDLSLAVRDAWLGYAAPALLVMSVVLLPEALSRRIWIAFVSGICVHIGVAFVAVAASETSPSWDALSPAGRVVMWKFEMLDPSLLFARWVGNANKASNVLLLGLLLVPTLLRLQPRSESGAAHPDAARMVAGTYLVLAVVMLVLLFSRATLILLPFALVAGGWWRVYSAPVQRVGLAIGGTVLAGLLLGVETIRDALLLGRYPNGETMGILSTYLSDGGRLDQAHGVLLDMSARGDWIFGIGAGEYGLRHHGSLDAGTHNFFIDAWLAGGLPALLLSLSWMLTCALRSLRRWRQRDGLLGLVSIGVLFLLMTREYSACYLGALSMGGIWIMIVIAMSTGALAVGPPERNGE